MRDISSSLTADNGAGSQAQYLGEQAENLSTIAEDVLDDVDVEEEQSDVYCCIYGFDCYIYPIVLQYVVLSY